MCENNYRMEFSFTTASASQNKEQIIYIEKPRTIIPIVFIPGIMGSNLSAISEQTNDKSTEKVWRLDDSISAIGWSFPYYGTAKARKLEFDPEKTEVDDRGLVIDAAAKEIAQVEQEYENEIRNLYEDDTEKLINAYKIKQQRIEMAIKNNPENKYFGTRKERGWGTIAYISYGQFLETFQESLFNPKGHLTENLARLTNPPSFTLNKDSKVSLSFQKHHIEHCQSFYLPVHVMGYNWLKSNADSAKQLKNLIEVDLPEYYKKRGQTCNKVILVTHSMGGLVARYYTEALGGRDKVYGVINGVQPSTGAVTAYTRMKRGSEINNCEGIGKIKDWIMEHIIGKDAAEVTAVCAQSPGPLELLPTPEYGMEWLTITDPDGKSESYPKADPYNEIYLAKDKWWCVCEPHLINPLNEDYNQQQMQEDWNKYKNIIKYKVKKFNDAIANKYHPNTYVFFGLGDEHDKIKPEFLTYQTAHWQGSFAQGYQTTTMYTTPNHIGAVNRLNLKELSEIRSIVPRRYDWKDAKTETHYGIYPTKIGNISEIYRLLPADSNGDGTVSHHSGAIPMNHLQARMHLPIGHEPAYQSMISQEFTLRAIVDILQKVKIDE